MDTRTPVSIQRSDYQISPWQIRKTQLYFSLHETSTQVSSELHLQLLGSWQSTPALVLDGVDLQLHQVSVDGVLLDEGQYKQDDTSLTLNKLPAQCVLKLETVINPQANLALEGLYLSSGNFCTQCEAEGFRKISYYLDRPDILSVFDVAIEAEASAFPVLLSNGNLVSSEELDNGRHVARWHDPHPKPCYLFALVAGDLAVLEDSFVTASGRSVLLQIFVQAHNATLCDYAMGALKRSMRWDEQAYGFEYDLERFMIVAVDDFNMGAMENKGLNIFNSRYVLADIHTASDTDFLGIEAVVAHEYFHNWTGNRITCQDWFQLSLKEGLTVFRDQCFSGDMHSATVKRIADVRLLRARQFPEDASPMAHPIRPDSYVEINNFYTLTVYEKGAEVIRMLHTLLGAEAWRSAMDEYVSRHDGSATTCEAFIDAMQSVSDIDLTQFRLWYSVAGTPQLSAAEHYDESARRYTLRLSQHTPDTPGQRDKPPLHVPIRMGLIDHSGQSMMLQADNIAGAKQDNAEAGSILLNLTEKDQTFTFDNVASAPVASLLRGFSAPVKLEQHMSDEQLAVLVSHDADAFNRWEALQRLCTRAIEYQLNDHGSNQALAILKGALTQLLDDNNLPAAFKAEALQLPSIDTLAEAFEQVDYQALGKASDEIHLALAIHCEVSLIDLVKHARNASLELLDDRAMELRRLANAALVLVSYLPESTWVSLARDQFVNADNMTDKLAAIGCLCQTTDDVRESSLQEFYEFAAHHKLVMDKWFAIQAMSRRTDVLDEVKKLYVHQQFDVRNPNRVRALIASYAVNNPVAFHARDGSGYAFLTERVLELDKINPQVAAALVKPLTRWARLLGPSQQLMHSQLTRILDTKPLSNDVYELVSKSLTDS